MDEERNAVLKNITELLEEVTDMDLLHFIYLVLYGESLERK